MAGGRMQAGRVGRTAEGRELVAGGRREVEQRRENWAGRKVAVGWWW